MTGQEQDGAAAQHWDPRRYNKNAGFVAELGAPLLDLLQPRAGERILDLGCGEGALTARVAAAGAAVVGVDASPDQIAAAKARGLDARVMSGEALTFAHEFEAVLSNAALHWMLDPDAVLRGVARALKPGGRFVAEMGGAGNVAMITAALFAALEARGLDPNGAYPWYFPTPEAYQAKLEAVGFAVDSIALIPRPTPLPGAIGGWLETFAESFLKQVPAGEQRGLIDEVAERLRPDLCDAEGNWSADYVRLRFMARLAA
ncbi:methyltransferase domain-containing protein [Pelagibius litoralis]|uniref:Methyltransferase domain-containing protein n=1 Tax=Pelagibius litoralis TaxID=374515 RepID=A0A967EVJ7_9PROT|nr:class I SAM-dependent methyltransferase [Pelagibius litoralis]NIA68766.1 methyltransferase domain-containing protein [Pelagibius litoralis]